MTVWVLGLNAFHADSAACLLRDGVLVAAAEEERFRRVKHWAGFPTQAIEYCLKDAGIELSAVAHVAVNRSGRANFLRKLAYVARHRPALGLLRRRIANRRQWSDIAVQLQAHFPAQRFAGKVHAIEHHEAHLASAFLVSPFARAAVVSVDGFGDFSSAAWALGEGCSIDVRRRIHFPHSLGIFYEALTQYLGFECYGDEYKVMGLAPYGRPDARRALDEILQLKDDGTFALDTRYFTHARTGAEYGIHDGVPSGGRLYSPALCALLGPPREAGAPIEQRHRDIAASVQAAYEDAFFNLLNVVHGECDSEHLALAGGCAQNSAANGKIAQRTGFTRCYVHPAAGDAGGAIGAAFSAWHRLDRGGARFVMDNAAWGPAFDGAAIGAAIAARSGDLERGSCRVEQFARPQALCEPVARCIADGGVVGWFQGRMEWGPRALGNRSILADPRRADMKDIINEKIKRRESFRPFAPSVLRENVADWFDCDADVPFMSQVFPIRAERRASVPAVTHVDGTGRLQTVSAAANQLYHRLISCFDAIAGVPMLLNTSFNENEPVVCRPEEAIDCFVRTKMDALAIGSTLLVRQG